VVQALVLGHRIDDGFDPAELLFIYLVCVFLYSRERADAGQHAHQILDRSHLLQLAQLITKIFQRKAVAGKRPSGHFLGFLLVNALFRFFDQRENVTHAQNAGDDPIGMKGFEGVILFTHAYELDGLSGDLANGKRRASASVAIHFCQDDAGQRKLFVELVGGVDRVLTGHSVSHEQNFLRIQQPLERLHLVHQLIVDV
jgi:hypothetical protein